MNARALTLGLCCAVTAALGTPSGNKWRNLPSGYQVFAHPSINGISDFQGTALPRVQSGFARWTSAQVSCTQWSSSYGGTFGSGTPTRALLNGTDRLNRVVWLGGGQWPHDSMTLGITTTTFFQSSGEIFDADMEMNNNRQWKVSGTSARIDVESITTHEAGHYLGLDHTPNSAAIMFATYTDGELKRALQTQDVDDVCTVYPKTGGTGTQGSFCTSNTNCAAGSPVCRGMAGDSKICTVQCTSNANCPNNYACSTDSTGGKSCLRPVGSPDLCKFCTTGSQCLSGMCVTDGRHNWCTTSCSNPANPGASCGAGYTCVPMGGSSSYICQPLSGCPTQCAGSAQCPVGYACVSGQCEATGKAGDRCELSTYCDSCTVCIGTAAEAYCRACCGGSGGGGTCSSCSNPSCPSPNACLQVSGSPDSICVPTRGVEVCESCDATRPCREGLTCTGGRCLATCNPSAPGGCSACFTVTAGSFCACADQVATKGQACAASTAAGRVCANGLLCLGSPSTCHEPCTDDANCDSGEICATRDGKKVCLPSNTPGTKCNVCAGGACGAGLVCYNNRCYPPCDVDAPVCGGCVDVAGADDVCACDDSLSAPGQFCGEASGDVYACAPGATCVDQICRRTCVPDETNCEPGTTCQGVNGGHVCAPGGGAPPSDAGTVPVNQDAGRPAVDGGSHAVGTTGCGCGAAEGTAPLMAFLLLGMFSVLTVRGRTSFSSRSKGADERLRRRSV